jgi:hypothetical protein
MAEIRINATGELKLYDSDDSNYVSFKSGGTVSSNVTWTLPTADGSNGQALTTDGSGTLSWATASSADPSSADGDSLGTASAEWSDLYLADGGIVYFGNDQDIRLTHNADKGLIIKHSATADDKPVILTLQTGETDMAANDVIGKIEFQAPDEGTGTDAVLVSAAIQAVAEGDHSSSSNATRIEFMVGASEAAAKKMQLTSAGKLEVDGGLDVEGGVVFNEDSASVDFRVESNGDANCLIVDGSGDKVGIGEDVPEGKLHVMTGDASVGPNANADELVVEGSGHTGMSILSGNSNQGGIYFGDDGDDDIGRLYYNHSDNSFNLYGNATNFLYMDSSIFVFNEDSNNIDFRVESNNQTHMFFVDAGLDRIGIGTSGPSVGDLHVKNTDDETLVYLEGTAATRSTTAFIVQSNDNDGGYDLIHAKRSSDVRFLVEHDGDCQNDNNSYGSTSDERIKQNITDANSQWDDIKALKIKNFKLKSDVASGNKIGVIAQDLETDGMSGLVKEHRPSAKHIEVNSEFGTLYTANDSETKDAVLYTADDKEVKDGDKKVGDIKTPSTKRIGDIKTETSNVKTVKYSVLYMKAIKALQEAQTRIETLETKVKTLEDA